MAIKAHNLATKIDTTAMTVTFSMLDAEDVAFAEHTMPIEALLGIMTFILDVMEEAGMLDDEDLDEETEVAGHC